LCYYISKISMSEAIKYPNPLPTRFKEVAEKRRLLEEGITLTPEGFRSQDFYDISNACQAVIIERLSSDLIKNWKSPQLSGELPFYQDFSVTYYEQVTLLESEMWQKIVQEVVSDSELDLNNLSPLQAAVLTLASMTGYEYNAANSSELFVELALHAEVYEKLLRKVKMKDFSQEEFEELLRVNLPALLKRLIALDSVIIDYYRASVMDRSTAANEKEESEMEYLKSTLQTRYFELDESFVMIINPKLIELFKKQAYEMNDTTDSLGRSENRGCPFLKTRIQDDLINFAIEELIKQRSVNQS